MYKYKIIILEAIILLLSSCKTTREIQGVVQPANEEAVNTSQPQTFAETRNYQWISYRGTADVLYDGKNVSCNYFMVNRLDSIIYLNLSVFGIELARLVAKPDEVIFVNKLSKEYYQGDYKIVEKYLKFPADFYTLQSVFNGDTAAIQKVEAVEAQYNWHYFDELNRTLFDQFTLLVKGKEQKITGKVTNPKIDVPGPTGIKIPEGFSRME